MQNFYSGALLSKFRQHTMLKSLLATQLVSPKLWHKFQWNHLGSFWGIVCTKSQNVGTFHKKNCDFLTTELQNKVKIANIFRFCAHYSAKSTQSICLKFLSEVGINLLSAWQQLLWSYATKLFLKCSETKKYI